MSAKRPDSDDKRIGNLLRARRLVLAMSQSELGERVGVSFQQIQKYERGINRVGAGRLARMSEALGVPPAHFFAGTENPMSPSSGPGQDELLSDRKNLRALVAYGRIGDESLRDAFLDLVEQAARCFPARPAGRDKSNSESAT